MAKDTAKSNNTAHAYYGRNVLHSIIVLAVNEISGVVPILPKAVKFKTNDLTMSATVNISLKYGHNAADVAYRVQENIKRSIETMTEYRMESINVNILSVYLDEGN